MIYYTGRKPIRGHATEFRKLDTDVKWLNFTLGRLIIRGNSELICETLRCEISDKMKRIHEISREQNAPQLTKEKTS